MNTQPPKEKPSESAGWRFSRVSSTQGSISASTTKNTLSERLRAYKRVFTIGKLGKADAGKPWWGGMDFPSRSRE